MFVYGVKGMVVLSETVSTACQEKDRKIFDELVQKHHKHAYNIAYRMTGNHADAEDLAQDTFLKAYRFFGTYRREMPFENWLYRIMSNMFVDWLRRRPKTPVRSLDEPIQQDEGQTSMDIADTADGPENLALSHELDTKLQHALDTLPPDFRLTLILSDIEGLSYEEVSEVMKCSIGTVRSRLHRVENFLEPS